WRRKARAAAGRELHSVDAGECARAKRVAWRIVRDGGNRVFMAQRDGRRIVQIPDPSVHSRIGGEKLLRPNPVERNQLLRGFFFRLVWFVRARKFANQFALRVENIEGDRASGSVGEVVIDNRAVGRVFAGWL